MPRWDSGVGKVDDVATEPLLWVLCCFPGQISKELGQKCSGWGWTWSSYEMPVLQTTAEFVVPQTQFQDFGGFFFSKGPKSTEMKQVGQQEDG